MLLRVRRLGYEALYSNLSSLILKLHFRSMCFRLVCIFNQVRSCCDVVCTFLRNLGSGSNSRRSIGLQALLDHDSIHHAKGTLDGSKEHEPLCLSSAAARFCFIGADMNQRPLFSLIICFSAMLWSSRGSVTRPSEGQKSRKRKREKERARASSQTPGKRPQSHSPAKKKTLCGENKLGGIHCLDPLHLRSVLLVVFGILAGAEVLPVRSALGITASLLALRP